jgi:hypothetical protein
MQTTSYFRLSAAVRTLSFAELGVSKPNENTEAGPEGPASLPAHRGAGEFLPQFYMHDYPRAILSSRGSGGYRQPLH